MEEFSQNHGYKIMKEKRRKDHSRQGRWFDKLTTGKLAKPFLLGVLCVLGAKPSRVVREFPLHDFVLMIL